MNEKFEKYGKELKILIIDYSYVTLFNLTLGGVMKKIIIYFNNALF